MFSCDVVSLQFWKKSDDHTESRQYRTNHSQETSSVSCVITYELFNLVKWVPVFVWYGSFSPVHGCETVLCIFLFFKHLQSPGIWNTPPYACFFNKQHSLHLSEVFSSSPSLGFLFPIMAMPFTISRVNLTVLLPVNVMLHTRLTPHSSAVSRAFFTLCSSTKQYTIYGQWTAINTVHARRHGIGFPTSGWSPTPHVIPVHDVARDPSQPHRITTTL